MKTTTKNPSFSFPIPRFAGGITDELDPLLAQACEGDVGAVARLYEWFHPLLLSLAQQTRRRRACSPEDLVQAFYVQLLEGDISYSCGTNRPRAFIREQLKVLARRIES